MTGRTVLDRLAKEFPDLLRDLERARYYSFNFRKGATIYVPYSDHNRAHITLSSLENGRFPNSSALKAFAESQRVEIHETRTNSEYWFRFRHIDRVIAILKGE